MGGLRRQDGKKVANDMDTICFSCALASLGSRGRQSFYLASHMHLHQMMNVLQLRFGNHSLDVSSSGRLNIPIMRYILLCVRKSDE